MQDAQQIYKWGSVSSVSLEMGSRNGLQPARYNRRDRLLAQVRALTSVAWMQHS